MTWTYTLATLATTPKDQVRLMIEDTDTTDQQLQDEEIQFFLTQEGSVSRTAARCAETLAAKYARQADRKVGDMSLSASQRSKAYLELAARIRQQARINVAPYAGGISAGDKEANAADTDRVSPSFWVDMERNPGVANPTDRPLEGMV